jgi:hypothetical protein
MNKMPRRSGKTLRTTQNHKRRDLHRKRDDLKEPN